MPNNPWERDLQAEANIRIVNRSKKILYDPKCYDLAAEFIDDLTPMDRDKLRDELAEEIQKTIENFLDEKGML